MVEKFRQILRGPAGKAIAIVIVLGGLALMVSGARDLFGQSPEGKRSTDRIFICSETGKTFEYTIKLGDVLPVESPYSKKKTGYPAQECYWTKDGKVKSEPTYVFLKQLAGQKGPTFCPDCGRLVVLGNPPPLEGVKAPPTEAEMKSREGQLRARQMVNDSDDGRD